MNASFDQDGLDGDLQGYARLTLELDEYDGVSFAENDSIAIGRPDPQASGAMQYLNPDQRGWSGIPRPLKLASRPQINGDSAEFILQAAYMDQVESGIYDILLLSTDGTQKAHDRQGFEVNVHSLLPGKAPFLKGWNEKEETAASPELAHEATGGPQGGSILDSGPEGVADPEKSPDLPGEGPMAAGGSGPEESEASHQEAAEIIEVPVEPALDQHAAGEITAPAAPAKKSQGGLIAAIVALCVLLGAGGAWHFMKNKAQAPEQAANQATEAQKAAQQQRAEEEAAKAEAEKKAAQEAAARAETEKAAAAAPRARVSKFFAGNPDPDSAMELAREIAPENSEDEDAVFRLYYYAAQNGNAEGAQKYAEAVDPSLSAFGTVKKNATEAWQYYGKAENGQESQERVRAWTEQHARAGNRQAREWLKEME